MFLLAQSSVGVVGRRRGPPGRHRPVQVMSNVLTFLCAPRPRAPAELVTADESHATVTFTDIWPSHHVPRTGTLSQAPWGLTPTAGDR